MFDISSEGSDVERANRKERAKKLTDPDFISSDEGSEIPFPPKSNTCTTSAKRLNFTSSDAGSEIPLPPIWNACTSSPKRPTTNLVLITQLEDIRHAIVKAIDCNICFTYRGFQLSYSYYTFFNKIKDVSLLNVTIYKMYSRKTIACRIPK